MRFTEIEHKFVVDDGFDLAAFGRALDALGPSRRTSLQVRDRYFLTRDGRAGATSSATASTWSCTSSRSSRWCPIRKCATRSSSTSAAGTAIRPTQVDAFVARMGVTWSGVVQKDLDVWYFPDCEVVHYVASSGSRTVRCVEFEARHRRLCPTRWP